MKKAKKIHKSSVMPNKILYKLLENTHLSTVQFEICLKADIVKLMSQYNGGNGPLACRAATVKANFD